MSFLVILKPTLVLLPLLLLVPVRVRLALELLLPLALASRWMGRSSRAGPVGGP